jgi:mono/diheme cytochrome c family protein
MVGPLLALRFFTPRFALSLFSPCLALTIFAFLMPVTLVAAENGDGKILFQRHCAECHGAAATGSDKGPPLVHRIYAPNHHADFSFFRAIEQGVRSHHWRFGDMAPVPAVQRADAAAIVRHIRDLQRANGIE